MPETTPIKFVAFLSYAHADKRVATWLHRSLEGFRIDADLVGRDTPRGPVPRSLAPIFRDRNDFSGGHTLTEATISALDASGALIVVCSPVAATRPAVNEEVRLFRWRNPDRPVIPVIVEGTAPSPRGSEAKRGEGPERVRQASPEREGRQQPQPEQAAAPHPAPLPVRTGRGKTEDSFPPALRFEIASDGTITDAPVTILGVDLREAGDGRDLGLAKVIAGLTGLAPDDIYRRAERQRKRAARIRAAIAASLIALAGAGGFFYWRTLEQGQVIGSQVRVIADQSKREAEIREIVQRELARRPAGQAASPNAELDLAAAVRSLLAQADDGDATAARIADLLRAGRTDEAIDVQVAAAEARERRAATEAKRAAKDYREAAALAASAQPARARDLYARAAKLDPDDVEGMLHHGWMQQQAGQLGTAEAAYRRVLDIAKRASHDLEIGWAHFGLGDILVARGDLDAALAAYRRGATVFDRLATSDPGNAGWQRDLSVSYDRVGDVLVAQGNLPAALESFKASLALAERLAKDDPRNAGWQHDLSVSNFKIGQLLLKQGSPREALPYFEADLVIVEGLAKLAPDNVQWQQDAEISRRMVARVRAAAAK